MGRGLVVNLVLCAIVYGILLSNHWKKITYFLCVIGT